MQAVLNGPIRVSLNADETGVQGGASCIYNTMFGRMYAAFTNSLGGLAGSLGSVGAVLVISKFLNLSWVSILMLKPSIGLVQIALYESIYFLFIVSILLPIFIIFITITLAKEIAKALGTEIDLTSLEKII